MSESTNRTGRVSSINYKAGTYEVTYLDRGQSVTMQVNAVSNGEYKMPQVGQVVTVSHNSNGSAAAVTGGTVWNQSNRPAEGYKGLYRKELGEKPGEAYDRYDANTGAFSQVIRGSMERRCGGAINDAAGGPVKVTGKEITITAGGATIHISEGGDISIISAASLFLSAPEVVIEGTIINATAGAGDVEIGGKSLVNHTHTSVHGETGKPN